MSNGVPYMAYGVANKVHDSHLPILSKFFSKRAINGPLSQFLEGGGQDTNVIKIPLFWLPLFDKCSINDDVVQC